MPALAAMALIPLIFFGDSLAVGMSTAHSGSKGSLAREGWGLSHLDTFHQARWLGTYLEYQPTTVTVVEVGTNDLDDMTTQPNENWRNWYRARVRAVADAVGDRRALWLGMPEFCGPNAWRNARASVLSDIVRRELQDHPNIQWIDSRPFTRCGDPNRASDGVHYKTSLGYALWLEAALAQANRE